MWGRQILIFGVICGQADEYLRLKAFPQTGHLSICFPEGKSHYAISQRQIKKSCVQQYSQAQERRATGKAGCCHRAQREAAQREEKGREEEEEVNAFHDHIAEHIELGAGLPRATAPFDKWDGASPR